MKKRKVFGIVFIILGMLLLLTPHKLAPLCPPMDDGHFMKCHWMGQAVMGQGGIMVVTGIFFILVKEELMAVGISISNVVLGIETILLPLTLIGGCKMQTMACNVHTKPAVYLLTGIYILCNLIYLLRRNRGQK